MGYGYQIFLMMITFIMVISLHGCSISSMVMVVDAQEIQDLQMFMEGRKGSKKDQTIIKRVSEEDENEQKKRLILEKFRALLGLKSIKQRRNDSPMFLSASPSPSPAGEPVEAPAPSPSRRMHSHSHHHSSTLPTRHKIRMEKEEKGNGVRRILVPVLVSTAAGIAFVAFVFGLICIQRKIKKQRKKSGKTMSAKSKKDKVSINPTLDFLYLNSLGVDLGEQSTSRLKQTEETEKRLISHCTGMKCDLLEREVSNQEREIRPESENASSSSTREIMSVHEDDEQMQPVGYECDGGCGSIIPIECHSSDNESFHSFRNSQSSSIRLSNVSAGSIGDSSTYLPQIEVQIPPPSPPPEIQPEKTYRLSTIAAPHPPPPPPPTPPLFTKTRVFTLRSSSSSSSSRISLSPLSSDSCSGLKQNMQTDLLTSLESASTSLQTSPNTIPAPPCPPPPPRGNNKGPPPPPPSLFPQHTPLGKDGAPLPKLKPLHWDKVRAAPDRSMVWDKLRTSSFELDEEMIESLFGYTMQNSTKNDEAKSKTPSPSKHLLEPKRLQNITILLKALCATPEQVCNALMKGEGLCLQQLEALVKMVPTKEEEANLSSYKGDADELGSAEKFIKALLGIPFAFLRAEAMLYRETFEDEVVHLRNSFSMLEEACKELKSSRLFLKLLETVLKTGNRMNVGTIRGGARAFKLDALLKLSDVKGTDGKTTLLHFVVQEISRSEGIRVSDSIMGRIMNQKNKNRTAEEKEEDYRKMGLDLVSGLNTELYNVKKTATVDLDVLASSVSNLKEGITKLRLLTHEYLSEKDSTFVHCMHSFLTYAEKNLKELQEEENKVMLHVREITEYFHGDVSKDEANPLRIFVIVRDFLGMLDHVCKELRSLKVPSSPNPLAPFR